MQRAVFLDRDGVINPMVFNPDFGTVDSPSNIDEFEVMPQAIEAIRKIKELGFLVIVVSNQPGIAKGKFSQLILEAITSKMNHALTEGGAGIDAVYYCLHHPKASVLEYRQVCNCRKPSPGLLLRAADEWDIDLKQSYMAGDGITDVAAGQAAGTRTIFINPRKCYFCDEFNRQNIQPDYIIGDICEAVEIIGRNEG